MIDGIRKSLDYIDTLDPQTQDLVRICYQTAMRWGFMLGLSLAVVAFLACLFIKEKSLVSRDELMVTESGKAVNGTVDELAGGD